LKEKVNRSGAIRLSILVGTDKKPATAIVGQGYRGAEIEGVRIIQRSEQRHGIIRTPKAMIKLRSAIQPTIGQMKIDG
jgi:IS5 family transposase